MDNPTTIVLLILAAAVLLTLLWLIAGFNRFVRLRQHIKESWADIEVELKRRYDLIPNLVEAVGGYARHEKETLQHLVELRNKAAANHGPADSQAADESQMLLGLKRVFAVAEAYPQLKADQNFLLLQHELSNTEDRIAAARRFFNGNVRDINQLCATFPTNLVAAAFKFEPATFFELSDDAERVVPRVAIPTPTQPLPPL